ncbi:MAG: hypothetical protein ACI4XP_05940 [Acutalibacteraceae bacterium]
MINLKTEFDVSNDAWKIYRLMYMENLPKGFQIKENGRKHIEEVFTNGTQSSLKTLFFSGDTDVNFTKGFAHSRLECYKDLICKNINDKKYENKKEYLIMYFKRLNIIKSLTYSVVNISLILQSGNLQAVKQGIGNDRIDTFIWALDEYYNGNSCLLFNHSAYGTLDYLKDYLGLFENVYDYCKVIYHINESLVDEMIESGKRAIDSPERIIEFMNLVIRFWRQKSMYLHKCLHKKSSDNQKEIKNALDIVDKKMEKLFDLESCNFD